MQFPLPFNKMKKPLIYVCMPYRADTAEEVAMNIARAGQVGRRLIDAGSVPIIPHPLTLAAFGDSGDNGEITQYNNALLAHCSLMVVVGEKISAGMLVEIDFCNLNGIPVFNVDNIDRIGVNLIPTK